jgi:hypothetical protein
MQPGDLVLVGGYSYYEPVLIGEIREPFDPEVVVRIERYGREAVPARRVNWFAANEQRRFLSQGLSLLLSNRKAVVSIDKAEYGDEVYRIAYGDYVFGTNSRYIFQGPRYNNFAVRTVPGINLITYFAAAFNACELHELDKFMSMGLQEVMDNYFEQDVLYSFEIDFSSPGEYVLYAKRAALPLLVATLVSVTAGTISLHDARTAEVQNSATATTQTVAPAPVADACTLEIKDKYKAIMTAMNADRFKELCKLNKDAQDGVGLKVRVKQKAKH